MPTPSEPPSNEIIVSAIDAAMTGQPEAANTLLEDDDFWEKHEAWLLRVEEQKKREKQIALAQIRERRWSAIPAEYREDFDPKRSKMPKAVIKHTKGWTPDLGPGMGLMGLSGMGKTRLLVRVLHRLECSWLFLPSVAFADAVRDSFHHDYGVANRAEEVYDAAKQVRVLLLDDIGLESPTEFVGEQMMSIIEARVMAKRPILWTSNLTPDQLEKRHKHRGAALVRRLLEYSWTP